jgi:mannose-1-phosphate guanylyltransferase
MFAFTAGVFLNELNQSEPDIFSLSEKAYKNGKRDVDAQTGYHVMRVSSDDMSKIPSKSVDYAVMEKSKKVAVIPSDFGWNDLGSFDSLYDVLEKDSNGNTLSPVMIDVDSRNNLVIGKKRIIATVGVSDSIIVDTPDALLVAKRGESQQVKNVVELLTQCNEKTKCLTQLHSTVSRPWGSYTVLEETANYKIKSIVVRPGRRLSLQRHIHRSEHWVVVNGVATVTVGGEIKLVQTNESTYIPIGEAHRLENTGKIDLVIIETQVGQYLGEDDIIRMDDDYTR